MFEFINDSWLSLRQARRVGAYTRAKKSGMSGREARAFSDQLYPPTASDTAFEAKCARKLLLQEVKDEIRRQHYMPITSERTVRIMSTRLPKTPDWLLALLPAIWVWDPHSWLVSISVFFAVLYAISTLGWLAFARHWEIKWFFRARILLIALSLAIVALRGSSLCNVDLSVCSRPVGDNSLIFPFILLMATLAGVKVWSKAISRNMNRVPF